MAPAGTDPECRRPFAGFRDPVERLNGVAHQVGEHPRHLVGIARGDHLGRHLVGEGDRAVLAEAEQFGLLGDELAQRHIAQGRRRLGGSAIGERRLAEIDGPPECRDQPRREAPDLRVTRLGQPV